MRRRIALIIPYLGNLPHWFPYFVKSAATSSLLDVHLFTDAQVNSDLPDNFNLHPCTLAEFSALASRALSISASLQTAFKVCDFRPAFGAIFQRYIHDYEFWAFGDIDLVYGDVDSFLQPLLAAHDLLSFRRGWITGSFCVLRNCNRVNTLYRLSADWRRVFSSPDAKLFDEMGGHLYQDVLKGADVLSLRGEVDSFTHVVKRLAGEGLLRCAFNDLVCEGLAWGETVVWENGKLTRSSNGSEIMYLHYVVMKRRYFAVPTAAQVPDRFYIRNTGIYLERPCVRSAVSDESVRVLRGGFSGAQRAFKRYVHGQNETA